MGFLRNEKVNKMQLIIGGITRFHESRRACCNFFLRLSLCVIEYLVRLKRKNTFQKRSRRILNRGVNSFLKLEGGGQVCSNAAAPGGAFYSAKIWVAGPPPSLTPLKTFYEMSSQWNINTSQLTTNISVC